MRFTKDPDEQLDYTIDYTRVLSSGETIVESVWIVPTDLTKVAESILATMATVWLKGGTDEKSYDVINRIKTNSSPQRIFERKIELRIRAN